MDRYNQLIKNYEIYYNKLNNNLNKEDFIHFVNTIDELFTNEYFEKINQDLYKIYINQEVRELFLKKDYQLLKEKIILNLFSNKNKVSIQFANILLLSQEQNIEDVILKYFNVFVSLRHQSSEITREIFKKTYQNNRSLFNKFIENKLMPDMKKQDFLKFLIEKNDIENLKKSNYLYSKEEFYLSLKNNLESVLKNFNILEFVLNNNYYKNLLENLQFTSKQFPPQSLKLLIEHNALQKIENKNQTNFNSLSFSCSRYLASFFNLKSNNSEKLKKLNDFLDLFDFNNILDRTFLFQSLKKASPTLNYHNQLFINLFIDRLSYVNKFTILDNNHIFFFDEILKNSNNTFIDNVINKNIPIFINTVSLKQQMDIEPKIKHDIEQIKDLIGENNFKLKDNQLEIIYNDIVLQSNALGKFTLNFKDYYNNSSSLRITGLLNKNDKLKIFAEKIVLEHSLQNNNKEVLKEKFKL